MRYYTFLFSDADTINDYTDDEHCSVFPATEIKSLQAYAKHFTRFGEMIETQEANLYTFEAPEAIELPFRMNLNYTDIRNAKLLDDDNLRNAIQIMSQYDEGDIINARDYYDYEQKDWVESPFAHQLDRSKEQLIFILSSIAKTLGSVVTSQADGDDDMGRQVLITVPVKMLKVPPEEAIELLDTDAGNPLMGKTNVHGMTISGEEEDADEGEYGFGGDWWKNPQEAIRRIADAMNE